MLDSLVVNRAVQLNQGVRNSSGCSRTRVGLGRLVLSTDN